MTKPLLIIGPYYNRYQYYISQRLQKLSEHNYQANHYLVNKLLGIDQNKASQLITKVNQVNQLASIHRFVPFCMILK